MNVYTYDYDLTYIPSAPVVEIRITNGQTEPTIVRTALIDTGADATMIPISVMDQLNIAPIDSRLLRTVTGMRSVVDLYPVVVEIGPFRFPNLKVIATNRDSEIIVGRDILEHLIVILDGLASVTEIKQ
jgi:predicted aspartyl protease